MRARRTAAPPARTAGRAGRSVALLLAVAAVLGGPAARSAGAHAGLVRSDPAAGAALGASPATVRLTFSEQPAARLSDIRVSDGRGAVRPTPAPAAVPGDPASIATTLPKLGRGVYTVRWRGVSAVDGHVTSGSFAFGVGERPSGAAARATSTSPGGSPLEVVARGLLLAGLVALLGAATAGLAGFGGERGSELRLAAAGWAAAAAGLVLLFDAQRRGADTSASELLDTAIGEALVQRAVALGVAGLALLAAWHWRSRPRERRVALAVVAVASLAAIAVHVAAGHAGAGSWPRGIAIAAQTLHVAAVGVWIGGLAALLLGLRGAAARARSGAVRRFAVVAGIGIVAVAAAGTLRAVDELGAWSDLWSGAYGRAIVAKVALLALIAALAVRSRRSARGVAEDRDAARGAAADDEGAAERGADGEGAGKGGADGQGAGEPRADGDDRLGALRRTSRAELALAVVAIGLAAVLGTVAPPVAGGSAAPGLTATGADVATTTRVKLETASAEPGANSFRARVTDYDSGEPVGGARVRLRFTPLDDADIAPTTLRLAPDGDGTYAGTGANLAFDGRWKVTTLVQRARDAVEVPLELDVLGPEHFISIQRAPGLAPQYTAQLIGIGYLRIAVDPERAGRNTVAVDVFTVFEDFADAAEVVVTTATDGGRARQWPVRARGPRGRFVARVVLAPGANTIAVVVRDRAGTRMRAVFPIDVPR